MQTMVRDGITYDCDTIESVVTALTLRAAALIPSGGVPRRSGSYGYHRSSRLASRNQDSSHRSPSFSAVS